MNANGNANVDGNVNAYLHSFLLACLSMIFAIASQHQTILSLKYVSQYLHSAFIACVLVVHRFGSISDVTFDSAPDSHAFAFFRHPSRQSWPSPAIPLRGCVSLSFIFARFVTLWSIEFHSNRNICALPQ